MQEIFWWVQEPWGSASVQVLFNNFTHTWDNNCNYQFQEAETLDEAEMYLHFKGRKLFWMIHVFVLILVLFTQSKWSVSDSPV